jgi:putative ABC transport system ATP-binding protein
MAADPMESTSGSVSAATTPVTPVTSATPQRSRTVIEIEQLRKVYRLGQTRVPALRGVTLTIPRGEFVAITGPSGSGKSTLMNLLGLLDTPSSGRYWLNGQEVSRLAADAIADLRNRHIGFVFQGFNLLARSDALANVALPLLYTGMPTDERTRRARRALQLVGLGARLKHKPAELSGGQQQRVAIARALVNGPALLLADEPTGNLDTHTSVEIMAILQHLNAAGLTVVLVTHEPDIAAYAQRQIAFRDGVIAHDSRVPAPRKATDELTGGTSSASSVGRVSVTPSPPEEESV